MSRKGELCQSIRAFMQFIVVFCCAADILHFKRATQRCDKEPEMFLTEHNGENKTTPCHIIKWFTQHGGAGGGGGGDCAAKNSWE